MSPAAEEMLYGVVCHRDQFSFQMCLGSGDGSVTFPNRRQLQIAGAIMLNALDWTFLEIFVQDIIYPEKNPHYNNSRVDFWDPAELNCK